MEAVLLLDRHADSSEMYSVALSLAGFRPVIVDTLGSAPIDAVFNGVSVIVIEAACAARNDCHLLRVLQADRATQHIPLIALMSHPDAAIESALTAFGCAALLLKPCLPETLVATIRRVLHASQHGAAAQSSNRTVDPRHF